MKPNKMLRWATLASVGALMVACGGGVSTLGSGEDDPGKGGSSSTGTAGTKGDPVTGTAGKGGTANGTAGKDPGTGTAGTGVDPGTELCKQDDDCPNYGAPCEPCADGSYACNKTYCDSGKCVHTRDECNIKCASSKDCPVIDVACKDCGDGSQACPTSECIMGACQTSFQGCGGFEPCDGVACGSPCKSCSPDGMGCTDALTYCNAAGQCTPSIPQCTDPGECKTAKDCGTAPPDCKPCGNNTCAALDCEGGKCVFGCQPDPEPQCKTSDDCALDVDECKTCPSSMKCAVPACLQGSCELVCPLE